MRTSGKVLKDFENLRKSMFDAKISHMAFVRDGKIEILYTQEYVDKLEEQLQQKENIIKEVREYIENNDLYEQDYDYDYEENLVLGPPSDETARKILLEILNKGENND